MAENITTAQAKLDDLINRSVASAQAAAKTENDRAIGEVKAEIAQRAAEVNALEAEIAGLKVRNVANTPANDGPSASLRREFGHGDDLALFPASRGYTIDGKAYNEVADGLLTSQRTFGDAHAEVKTLWEAGLVKLALRGKRPELMSPAELVRDFREANPQIVGRIADRVYRAGLAPDRESVIKRVFGVSAGNGSEFIPGEVLAPEMLRIASAAIMDSPVGLFVQRSLDNLNVKSPLGTARPRPYLQGSAGASEVSELLRSTMGTSAFEYAVKNMAVAIQYDRNASDDSIIAFMPELRAQMAEAMALGLFDAVLNGDTASTHQDSLSAWAPEGVFPVSGTYAGGALDHRRSVLGLRARAFDIGSAARYDLASSYTFAKIQAMHAKMGGGVGQNPSRTAIFASFSDILLNFSTIDQVATLEKFGPQATVLTGQVGMIGGKPVVRAWPLGITSGETGGFTTAGLHSATGGNNTKPSIVMVDLDRYILGTRQGLRIEAATDILTNTGALVASGRYAFESPDHATAPTTGSTVNVVVGYSAS